MDKVKIYIESKHIALTEVKPLWKDSFSKKKDSKSIHYIHEISNKVIFHSSEDYKKIFDSCGDECAEITIYFKEYANGEYVDYWVGFFKVFDTDIDEDSKRISVKPKPLDDYKCITERGKEEINMFDCGPLAQTLNDLGRYETKSFSDGVGYSHTEVLEPQFWDVGDENNWCLKSHDSRYGEYEDQAGDREEGYNVFTVWHRFTLEYPCENGELTPPPYSDWMLLKDECSTKGTATWWRCPTIAVTFTGRYTNGRHFKDFLSHALTSIGCNVLIKSDFYNINPKGDHPSNRAYDFSSKHFLDLTIHQKSDIKRPDGLPLSTEPSWKIKPIKFLEDLVTLHNVRYVIENGVFIIEHVSFFESLGVTDLTTVRIPRKYSFKGAGDIKEETFNYSDDRSSELFKANPIKYECGTDDKAHRLNLLNCDLPYISDKTKEEIIDDAGFVLLVNGPYLDGLTVVDSNVALSWPVLHLNLHRHDRLYPVGEINGDALVFDSYKPYKKGEKFTLENCKSNRVDPRNKMLTSLGEGTISKLTEHIINGNTELEINY